MKQILIPTDFSKNAWNAIDYAMNMFADERCTFILLNTFTPAIPTTRFLAPRQGTENLEDAIRVESETRLNNTVAKICHDFPNRKHKFKIISSFNLLVDEITEIVNAYEIDLILTGTKGASGIRGVYLGSNTVNIIKHTKDCPVMAIPRNYKFVKPREIVFATDFNRCFTEIELRPLVAIARNMNAVVRVVYVQEKLSALSTWQQFNLDTLRRLLNSVDYFIQTISEVESVSNTLELFTKEMEVQLLVMLNYHHSYIEKMTREPVVKRTAFQTKIPLLVLPEFDLNELDLRRSREQISKR